MFTKFLFQLRRVRKRLRLALDSRLVRSSDLFDKEWYLEHNPDVVQSGIDPVYHYLVYGGLEGRNPGPNFHSRWYLDTYPDVQAIGLNPLVHYLKYGRKEGRREKPQLFKLSRLYDYSKQRNKIVFEDSPERIYLQCPNVVGSFSGALSEGEAFCPLPYIAEIEEAVIFGGDTLVIVDEDTALNDELVDFNSREFGKKTSHMQELHQDMGVFTGYKKPDLYIKEGIFLSSGHDANYFHWMVESLPKLLLVDSLEQFKDLPLLIPAGLHKNLLVALERLNINRRPLIFIEPGSAYLVKRLIVPSALSRIVDRYEGAPVFNVDIVLSHKWLQRISESLKGNINYGKKPWRKIFLTRRKGLRALGNREQVELMLLKEGFEIVELDGASLDFQIELFSQASLIIAPTGAALTNMLFCHPGTKVFIFMSNHETTNFYFWSNLGAINHLDVTTIVGQRSFKLTDYYSVHDDYVVDTQLTLNEIRKSDQ